MARIVFGFSNVISSNSSVRHLLEFAALVHNFSECRMLLVVAADMLRNVAGH